MNCHKILIPTVSPKWLSFPIIVLLLAVLIVMIKDTPKRHEDAGYEILFYVIILMPIGTIISTDISIRVYLNAVFKSWVMKKYIKYWVLLLLPIHGLLTGYIINL